ncbi:hypothetical protein E2C01_043398 [Portunus trituberculatus]|uniref:Uncharacterized protein n=1 Tax=Portunus trituberculatus TaxID=210409 RepID=A0A5B7FWL1_PORTR|nr:hypothetical protein [Portunus trituberculatus]
MDGRNLHRPLVVVSFINAFVKGPNLRVRLKDVVGGGRLELSEARRDGGKRKWTLQGEGGGAPLMKQFVWRCWEGQPTEGRLHNFIYYFSPTCLAKLTFHEAPARSPCMTAAAGMDGFLSLVMKFSHDAASLAHVQRHVLAAAGFTQSCYYTT